MQPVMQQLLNIVVVVFIVATMLTAGLGTTTTVLGKTLRHGWLVLLVLLVNIVLVPLLGWGLGALLALQASAAVVLILIACSPGAPFGAKLAMIQKGDVAATASLQVLLAVIGSITFPITANLILQATHVGGNITLPVGQLVATVAVLQLVPFVLGLLLRMWAPNTADEWQPFTLKTSNLGLLAVLAIGIFSNWQQIVALIGSLSLLGALLFAVGAMALGALVSIGSWTTRTSLGTLAPQRNAGPILAAIGIAFNNDSALIGTASALLLVISVVTIAVAAYLARRRAVPAEAGTPVSGKRSIADQTPTGALPA